MPILLKMLLTEALDQLFHATDTHKLLKILKSDALKLTYADASAGESKMARNYPFYLSTSREKYGGYARGGQLDGLHQDVVLVIDGKAVERTNGFKMFDVDYWGKSDTDRQINHNETEERIVGERDSLIKLKKYVSEIHIFCKKSKFDPLGKWNDSGNAYKTIHNVYLPLIQMSSALGIPTYFYVEGTKSNIPTAFRMQRKDFALSPDQASEYFLNFEKNSPELMDYSKSIDGKPPEDQYTYKSSYHDSDIRAIEYFIDMLNNPGKYIEAESSDKELDDILRYFLHYPRDLIGMFESNIHNKRDQHPEIFQKLASAIRKNGFKSLKSSLESTSNILRGLYQIKSGLADPHRTTLDEKLKSIVHSYSIEELSDKTKQRIVNYIRRNDDIKFTKKEYNELSMILKSDK